MDKRGLAESKRVEGGYGLYLFDGLAAHTSFEGGPKSLLTLYRHGFDGESYVLSIADFSMAEAYLCILLNIKEIQADRASSLALTVLRGKGVTCHYGTLVERLEGDEGLHEGLYPGQAALLIAKRCEQ